MAFTTTTTPTPAAPENLEQEQLDFLDELREGESVNMFAAAEPLQDEYPYLSKDEAREILKYWMRNFSPDGTKVIDPDAEPLIQFE